MKVSTSITSARSLSIYLLVITIIFCLQLAFLVITTSGVHAAPSFDTGIKKVDRLTRGGGGGGHGSGGGTHGGSEAGGHTTGSEAGTSHSEGEEENNSGNYHNNNSNSAYHSNNSNGAPVPSDPSFNQDNPSTLQMLWSFFIMCIGVAVVIYFIRRRTQGRL